MPADETRCRSYDDDYSALLDGELPPERAAELSRHVAGCDRCRARLASLRRVDTLVSARAEPPLPADLRAGLQARIEAGADTDARSKPARRRRWLEVPAAAALAAAAAALAYLMAPEEPAPREEPVRTARTPAPAAPDTTGADLAEVPVEDVAVGLELEAMEELETLEDLDVIANLELLEALLALEEGTS